MGLRRMISLNIINSARFLKLTDETQNLYFHLCLRADDDGIVEAFPVIRLINAVEDNMKLLQAKKFILILNDDLVTYILDWNEHNVIRADRKTDSIYQTLLLQNIPEIQLTEKKVRADQKKYWKENLPALQSDIQTDGLTDFPPTNTEAIQKILKVSESYLFPSADQKLIEAAVRLVFTEPHIANKLRIGFNKQQLQEKLYELRLSHIERAMRQYSTYKGNVQNTVLYFAKVLIESIDVADAEVVEELPYYVRDD